MKNERKYVIAMHVYSNFFLDCTILNILVHTYRDESCTSQLCSKIIKRNVKEK